MRSALLGTALAVVFLSVVLARDRAGSTPFAPQASPATPADVTAIIKQAYTALYNLDQPEALALARRSVLLGPSDANAHRTLAAFLWLDILFRRGAVVTDHYFGGSLKDHLSLPKPPPDQDAEFNRELGQAIELATARIRRDPLDLQARYDLGAAYALQASYTASVEGSLMSAFRTAKRAYDTQKLVLERDPNCVDAGLVVGTYRYLVSTMSLPTRMIAYVAGFGGGKDRGITLIEAATKGADTHIDARVALLLVYTREGRHLDALRVARELEATFPRNRLFTLEAGSAALRAGRAAEAEATLSRGLAAFEQDSRAKIPGEHALWLYKRGGARVALNRLRDARADLEAALGQPAADWVRGRVHLELGKIADLTERRPEAVSAYRIARTTCEASHDPDCADEAERLLRRPFRF